MVFYLVIESYMLHEEIAEGWQWARRVILVRMRLLFLCWLDQSGSYASGQSDHYRYSALIVAELFWLWVFGRLKPRQCVGRGPCSRRST